MPAGAVDPTASCCRDGAFSPGADHLDAFLFHQEASLPLPAERVFPQSMSRARGMSLRGRRAYDELDEGKHWMVSYG